MQDPGVIIGDFRSKMDREIKNYMVFCSPAPVMTFPIVDLTTPLLVMTFPIVDLTLLLPQEEISSPSHGW